MHEFCFYLAWAGWKPEVWAAWVQAIGSIAAIVAAFLIARAQSRAVAAEKRKADHLVAVSMATSKVRHVAQYLAALRLGLAEVNRFRTAANERLPEPRIPIPQSIWKQVHLLHLMGEPGGSILKGLYHHLEARSVLDEGYLWKNKYDPYAEQIEFAIAHVENGLRGLHRLLQG